MLELLGLLNQTWKNFVNSECLTRDLVFANETIEARVGCNSEVVRSSADQSDHVIFGKSMISHF